MSKYLLSSWLVIMSALLVSIVLRKLKEKYCRYQCAHFHITAFYHFVLTGNNIKCAPIDVKAVKLRPRSMTANFKLGHLKQNGLFCDMKYFPAVSSSTVHYSTADNSVHHTTLCVYVMFIMLSLIWFLKHYRKTSSTYITDTLFCNLLCTFHQSKKRNVFTGYFILWYKNTDFWSNQSGYT